MLGSAAALLHPIHFDEPFGLSVVEVDGVRDAGRRLCARVDGRGRGRGRHRLLVADLAVGRHGRRRGAAARPRRRSAHGPRERFGVDRMVDDLSARLREAARDVADVTTRVIASSSSSSGAQATPIRASSMP